MPWGVLIGLGEGGSVGGGVPPLSSSLIDIVEKVESTVNSGYWVCPCWGNSTDQDSILLNNRDVSLQKVSKIHSHDRYGL